MNRYQLDTLIQLTGTFTAADGFTPVDPTSVFLFVKTPDGVISAYSTSSSPAIAKASDGVYQIELATTQSGPWIYKWQGVGDVTVTTPDVYFTVAASVLVPLAPLPPSGEFGELDFSDPDNSGLIGH